MNKWASNDWKEEMTPLYFAQKMEVEVVVEGLEELQLVSPFLHFSYKKLAKHVVVVVEVVAAEVVVL